MSELNRLAYFLNSMKETLPFEDEKDFRERIAAKEFQIRVQKLAYLSKFFGWDNSYHFNFHEHGPYSVESTNDYRKIIAQSYDNLTNYNLFDKFASADTELNKDILTDKINGLKSIFEHFEICYNQTLILGSLEYLKMALRKENLNKNEKAKLINAIWEYAEYIEEYYFKSSKLSDDFAYHDLNHLNDRFDSLQDYISKDLKIIPKLYDEDVDLTYFC